MALEDIKEGIRNKKHQLYLDRECKKAQKRYKAYFLDEETTKTVEITNKNGEKEQITLYQLCSAHDMFLPKEMDIFGCENFSDQQVAKPKDAVAWVDKKTYEKLQNVNTSYLTKYQIKDVDGTSVTHEGTRKPTIYGQKEGEYPTIINSEINSGIITGNAYVENSSLHTAVLNESAKVKDSNVVCSKVLNSAEVTNGCVLAHSVVAENGKCDKSRVEWSEVRDNASLDNSQCGFSTFIEGVKIRNSYIMEMEIAEREAYGGNGTFEGINRTRVRPVIDGPGVDPEEMAKQGLKPYEFDGKKIYVSDDDMWLHYHLIYKGSGIKNMTIRAEDIFNGENCKYVLEDIYLRVAEGDAQLQDLQDMEKASAEKAEIHKKRMQVFEDLAEARKQYGKDEKLLRQKEQELMIKYAEYEEAYHSKSQEFDKAASGIDERKVDFNKNLDENEKIAREEFKINHPKPSPENPDRKEYEQPKNLVKVDEAMNF